MAKGWHRESRRHALASRGVKTAIDNNAEAMGKAIQRQQAAEAKERMPSSKEKQIGTVETKAKYKTLLNRASKVTLRTEWDNLNYNEKLYIRQGVDRMLANDYSKGGYGGKYKRYVLKGGKLPDLPE